MPVRMLLSALCGLGLLVMARPSSGFGPPGPAPGMDPERRLEKHLEELGLEPGQLGAVRALLDESRRAQEEQRERVRAAFEQMHALLDQDMPDESAVMNQAEVLGELHLAGHKAMLHTLLAVRAQLTPEQRAALRERMREDWTHVGRRHGPPAGVPDPR